MLVRLGTKWAEIVSILLGVSLAVLAQAVYNIPKEDDVSTFTKVICILLVLAFGCSLCFGLVGCGNKDPNEPSHWYGTYVIDPTTTFFVFSGNGQAGISGKSVEICADGAYLTSDRLGRRFFQCVWGQENYEMLLWEMENVGSKVKVDKRGAHMGHGTFCWGEAPLVFSSADHAEKVVYRNLYYSDFDFKGIMYWVELVLTPEDGEEVTFSFRTGYAQK